MLSHLHGTYRITTQFRQSMADAFPDVSVDWGAVDRSLAQGPPTAVLLRWRQTSARADKVIDNNPCSATPGECPRGLLLSVS